MKKRLLIVCLGLLFVMGCSEAQMKQGDKVATGVTNTGTALQQGLQSPAGALVPEPFRSLSELIIGGLLLLSNGWQTYRKSKLSAALDDLGQAGATTNKTSTVLDIANPLLGAINPSTALELKALGH
jgi:hypothetical protein